MERQRTWPWTAAVMLITALAWWPVRHAGWFWDDRGTFLENSWLLSPDFLQQSLQAHLGHWQPLSWWSLRLDRWLWTDTIGLAPVSGHLLTNVILHTLSAGALVHLLLAAARIRQRGPTTWAQPAAAAFATLAWALHPCRVESVAWATERRDVLATLFTVLGLMAWLRWRTSLASSQTFDPERGAPDVSTDQSTPRRMWLLIAALLFAASALAKAWVVALPGAILGLEIGLMGAGHLRRSVLRSAAWLALSVPVAIVAAWAQHSAGAASGAGLTVAERIVGAGHNLLTYLGLTALPLALSPLHPIVPSTTLDAAHLLALIGAVALTGLLVWRGLRRERTAEGEQLLGAWIGFVAWLSPVLGLMQSGVQAVAERYLILAHIPLAILLVPALTRWLQRRQRVILVLATLALVGWSVRMQAWQQVWLAGPDALWSAAIAVEPRSVHARVNRAALRMKDGEPVGDDIRIALALAPHDPTAWKVQAELLRRAGQNKAALKALQRASAAAPGNTDIACNLGALLAATGDRTGAEKTFDSAIDAGGGPDCYLNRAVLRVQLHHPAEALRDVNAAIRALPGDHPTRRRALGMARALQRRQP